MPTPRRCAGLRVSGHAVRGSISAPGQPAEAPGRLALATVLQFMEGLPDRQAADAVRARIDWKYALVLELTDASFDHTVLSEFCTRLVGGGVELLLLDALLERAQTLGLLKQRGKQRTDSTHILSAVWSMNRLERVGETLRAALNKLAVEAPEWLRGVAEPDWFARYGSRVENFNLPKTEAGRKQFAAVTCLDGRKLLNAINSTDARLGLAGAARSPATGADPGGAVAEDGGGQPCLRDVARMKSPAELTQLALRRGSSVQHQARQLMGWLQGPPHGKLRRCGPLLITNVETTPATTPDDNMVEVAHRSLHSRGLLPSEHLVDKGYTDATEPERNRLTPPEPNRPFRVSQVKKSRRMPIMDWKWKNAPCRPTYEQVTPFR